MENLDSNQVIPIAIVHQVIDDIDELETISRADGQRDIRLTQLSLGLLHCELIMVDYGEMRVLFANLNCPVRCVGPKVKGYIDFCCTLNRDHQTLLAHGYRTSPFTLSGMDINLASNVVFPSEQVIVHLQVKRTLVEECMEALNRSERVDHHWQNNFVYAPDTLPSVQAYLMELLQVVQQNPSFLKRSTTKEFLLEDLLPMLLAALPAQSNSTENLTALPRAAIVRQAEAYIDEHLSQPLTVRILAEALHISRRNLFYSFEEMFGMGPMAYVKACRLQSIHRVLKAKVPETYSIRSIAEQFGFWNPSHFARDYRKMFGESPRDTLKKKS